MAIASNKFRLLFLTRHRSDIEFKISIINTRRMALADKTVEISAGHSNTIFQTGDYSNLYNGQTPGLLPGFIGFNPDTGLPYVNLPPDSDHTDPIATGDYESQMAVIQAMDKELEIQVKSLESLHTAASTEVESVQKMLQKNIEKDYKTFG